MLVCHLASLQHTAVKKVQPPTELGETDAKGKHGRHEGNKQSENSDKTYKQKYVVAELILIQTVGTNVTMEESIHTICVKRKQSKR